MPKKRLRDIVIILPGILGSVLQKDGRDLWAISGQALGTALTSMGRSLQDLQLQGDDPDIDDLGDGIKATRLMPDVHLIPGLVKIDGYTETIRLITNHFEVRRGSIKDDDTPANFFEFPYDWRRDNRVAARRLKQLIDRKLPQWRQYCGAKDAKVIFLAHSMGGLVARHYLEVMEGWQNCRALITFGTPYRGSLNAVNYLANGYKNKFVDLTNVVRSFTSVYQLLPIYKTVKIEDTYERIAEINDIPNISAERCQQALAFHRSIEDAVNIHQNDSIYRSPKGGYTILPIVGTGQPTYQSCMLVNGQLTMSRELPTGIDVLLGDGDSIVPRLSAIPIELSDQYRDTYTPERHAALQNNRAVLNDLRGRLEATQVVGLGNIRGPEPYPEGEERAAISLDLDDLYTVDEPVELRAQLINWTDPTETLKARIETVSAYDPPAIEQTFHFEEDSWKLTVEELPPGLYRVTVHTTAAKPGGPSPVHDVFEIMR